jgi:TATA-box binding protein (TBP) (component of TFIID and TFIIIB)
MAKLDLEWEQFLNQTNKSDFGMDFIKPANAAATKASAKAPANAATRASAINAPPAKAPKRMDNDDEEVTDEDDDECVADVCLNEDIDNDAVVSGNALTEDTKPKCTPIYISTKTKISYLTKPVDIHTAFWQIPVLKYAVPKEGTIKKQMKFSTTDPSELEAIQARLKQEVACVNEFVIEHIENPEGRIKFKDQRKISIGLCRKDIVSYRIKQKRAFFNCFVVILRVVDEDDEHGNFKEMHVKVFNTGKLEIPGVKTDAMLHKVQTLLVQILKPILGDDLDFQRDQCETVLINSNFKCGYYINRDALYPLLKYKYRINCNYDACSYPGIQCKFFYVQGSGEQTGQQPVHSMDDATTMTNKHKKARNDTKPHYEISFMIFRTGSVLIVGKCNEDVLHEIYDFIRTMLETEYMTIGKCLVTNDPLEKKRVPKVRRKVLIFNEGAHMTPL